ncbi:ferredoxin III, nif-specific [Acetobacter sp.]|uniref:ferredoxin III, nif-specific n=1 Tax=Acetobacter sp. TaxID=440 RepID=UPI0039EA2067
MSATTRDGRGWSPSYLDAIDPAVCIGCGRCYKVCGRGVMTLRGVNDEGEIVDDEEDEDDIDRRVMAMEDAGACVGCGACARVCPTNCQTHIAA